MYYIVQKNTFKEENYDHLIDALDRLELPYEIVDVLPYTDEVKIKTKRTDIFPFGSLKLARISKELGWYPGSQMNDNHDYLVYKDYYKENLLNYDSKIIKFGDEDFFSVDPFFARPTKDTKVFTGKTFDMGTWEKLRNDSLIDDQSSKILNKDTEIQISSIKRIQKEIRFWIVKGEIVTTSQYKLGKRACCDALVDIAAYDFCEEMIKLFQLNEAFVMDVCMCDYEYKIVECGCINCAGFYHSNLQKLVMKLEYSF
jgi:hypothetical protein